MLLATCRICRTSLKYRQSLLLQAYKLPVLFPAWMYRDLLSSYALHFMTAFLSHCGIAISS